MSGGTKQQFKQFSITCAEDACLVLGMLISGMTVNLENIRSMRLRQNPYWKAPKKNMFLLKNMMMLMISFFIGSVRF